MGQGWDSRAEPPSQWGPVFAHAAGSLSMEPVAFRAQKTMILVGSRTWQRWVSVWIIQAALGCEMQSLSIGAAVCSAGVSALTAYIFYSFLNPAPERLKLGRANYALSPFVDPGDAICSHVALVSDGRTLMKTDRVRVSPRTNLLDLWKHFMTPSGHHYLLCPLSGKTWSPPPPPPEWKAVIESG